MIGKIRSNLDLMRLLVLATVVFTGGCSRMEDKKLTVRDVTYTFPASHIEVFTNPGEGTPYAKIRPPGMTFDLIYDYRAWYRTNHAGPDTPLVLTVNDHRSPNDFDRVKFPGGITICRDDHPNYGCGLRIEDNGIAWSVVFTSDQVPNSESIRSSAAEILKTYRS